MRCAVVNKDTNVVENIIMAEITDIPPYNTFLIEIATEMWCDIGCVWNGTNFGTQWAILD